MAISPQGRTAREPRTGPAGGPVFSALIGLSSLAVLLQGLWAGIFLEHDGKRDDAKGWIQVHAIGGQVATVLALAATVYAIWKLRSRKDLWIGGIVFTVLLVLEGFLGVRIADDEQDVLTAVHVPLAMLIMAVAVWLPLRAAGRGR